MWQLIGLAGVFVAIGVGYTIAGGSFGVIIEAAGPELLVILGPGLMTLLISNELSTVKAVFGGFKKVIGGPHWRSADYADALCLLFLLFRIARQEGNVAWSAISKIRRRRRSSAAIRGWPPTITSSRSSPTCSAPSP